MGRQKARRLAAFLGYGYVFSRARCLCRIQRIDHLEILGAFGDVGHVVAIVDEARHARLVHEHLSGHPSEFEELDLLPVELQYHVPRIGQTYERKLVLGPIASERTRTFRADHHYGRLASLKLGKVLAQLRQMRAAVWSREPTVEDEEDVLPSAQF